MLARTLGYGLNGVNGFEVKVEVYLSGGMMALEVVGLPDASVKESRDRVRAAIQNSGYTMPVGRLTVNLAPADMKKEGPAFDLPIALGILMASPPAGPAQDPEPSADPGRALFGWYAASSTGSAAHGHCRKAAGHYGYHTSGGQCAGGKLHPGYSRISGAKPGYGGATPERPCPYSRPDTAHL